MVGSTVQVQLSPLFSSSINNNLDLITRTVATTQQNNGTSLALHDHDAKLTYSAKDDQFLLTWEVDGTRPSRLAVFSALVLSLCAFNSHRPLAERAGSNDRKYVASQLLSNVTVPKRQFQ
jgi:hypothetical protein